MFSGIIEEKARIRSITKHPAGTRLSVYSGIVSQDARAGDSISVNGSCLTVVKVKGKEISFDVMDETLRRTSLRGAAVGCEVNLERSLKAGDRISGHFVTGHVDCVGRIVSVGKKGRDRVFEIEFPEDKTPYLAEKGSVAIDGISLTVGKIDGNRFRVYFIPLTLKETTAGIKKAGDSVNIEFDLLGKYTLKDSPDTKKKGRVDMAFLKEHGFA